MSSTTKRRQFATGSDALFKQERDVLRLWDNGHGAEEIAEIVGIGEHRVAKIVNYYDDCRATEIAAGNDALRGSTMLADAVLATGGRFA